MGENYCGPCRRLQREFNVASIGMWRGSCENGYKRLNEANQILEKMYEGAKEDPKSTSEAFRFCRGQRPRKPTWECPVSIYNIKEMQQYIERGKWLEEVLSGNPKEDGIFAFILARNGAINSYLTRIEEIFKHAGIRVKKR